MLVSLALLLGVWLLLGAWAIHILSGLPSALAAQGGVDRRGGARASARQQKIDCDTGRLAAE